jgi:small subunit ribosomal protein S16
MLHIRLRRTGKKKQPQYRLIVCEKSKDPWGDYLENLGTYNPRVHPSEIALKADRIKEWIAKGAQCSDTVWNMLVDQGVVSGDKRKSIALSKKRKVKVAEKSEGKKKEEAVKGAESEIEESADASGQDGDEGGRMSDEKSGKPDEEEPKAEPPSAGDPEGK